MDGEKQRIIESLHKIMCTATGTQADSRVENNDYFKRRVLGFRAEVEFQAYARGRGANFLEGGQFISRKLSGAADNKNAFIYVTLASDEPADFADLYARVAGWREVEELIYIKILADNWTEEDFTVRHDREEGRRDVAERILKPCYEFYRFDGESGHFTLYEPQDFSCVLSRFPARRARPALHPLRAREQFDYFAEYDLEVLRNIYANRYFIDVVLRQAGGRQIIDLDGFLVSRAGYSIVEIKEKSPIKPRDTGDISQWRFGWDSRRILWYLYIQSKLGLPVIYNVREIDNRIDRNFVRWDSIKMDDFLMGTSWSNVRSGGGGEDTLLAPYTFFSTLEEMLARLQN